MSRLIFRPFRACSLCAVTHGLRRGLHSYAASRLIARVAGSKRWASIATPLPGLILAGKANALRSFAPPRRVGDPSSCDFHVIVSC